MKRKVVAPVSRNSVKCLLLCCYDSVTTSLSKSLLTKLMRDRNATDLISSPIT